MRSLNIQLKVLCESHQNGCPTVLAERYTLLQALADHLVDLGYGRMAFTSLQPKHVEAVMASLQIHSLTASTLERFLNALRWWAETIGRPNIVARDSAYYGIPLESFAVAEAVADDWVQERLAAITDPHVRMSLTLQRVFGLRREEAIKFTPSLADKGSSLHLEATWRKAKRSRDLPVRTDRQRELLKQAHMLVGAGSLIPPERNYIEQLRLYEQEASSAGLSEVHGLRYRYAQERYRELTGWAAPLCGGPNPETLPEENCLKDRIARYAIAQELGHEREQLVAAYLGQ